jgi:hypothetical protein
MNELKEKFLFFLNFFSIRFRLEIVLCLKLTAFIVECCFRKYISFKNL